jgi:alpha/beta superfamily hydrolase
MRSRVPTQPCQVIVTPSDGVTLALEARYVPGAAGAAVVAPPHPLYGGTLENPVVMATLAGLQEASLATLAFNYRGVERSAGESTDSLEASVGDYAAALAELASRTPGPYFAAGYSFGAGTALLAARDEPRVAGVVLVAPPVGLLHSEDLHAFRGRLFVVVGDDDDYAPLGELTAILSARSDAVLTVIPGADHFFHFGGLTELGKLVADQVRGWL